MQLFYKLLPLPLDRGRLLPPPVDRGSKLNIHKTLTSWEFLERFIYVQFTSCVQEASAINFLLLMQTLKCKAK